MSPGELKLLKIVVACVFVRENEDGELEELPAEPKAMTASQLREFANGGLEESIKATQAALDEASN